MRLSHCITRAAQVAPSRAATTFAGHARIWAEVRSRVARLAAGLRTLGVGSGDRVAYLGHNSDRYLEWFFAVSWADAVVVPVNARLAPPEVEHVVNDSGAHVLFADGELAPAVMARRDDLAHVQELVHTGWGGRPGPDWHDYEELIVASEPVAPAPGAGGDLAGLFYTGGTTGRPKAVMLSHDNLISNVFHTLSMTGWGPDSVYLHAAPMFHLIGSAGMIGMAVCAGSNLIVERFTPDGILQAVADHGVTHALLVPTMIAELVEQLEHEPQDLGSLRGLHYAGSPITESLIERSLRVLPGVELSQGYGQTESSGAITVLPAERHVLHGSSAGKTRSAGQAALGVEVAILDSEGWELPRGQVGEICAHGDNVMLGYWNQPELTAETLRGGWLHTGDVGWMDDEGYVYVVDRLKDMIIVGASNVYSAEVENAVAKHPAVAECAVIGIPSPQQGEQVHAVVVLRDGCDLGLEELATHCQGLIADYKCPGSLDIRTEPLPKSSARKVLKTELRAPYWNGVIRVEV